MDIKEFSKSMINKMKSINIEIDNEKINQFYKYMELLIEWNEKINLTAINEPDEIILKHFVDCATILRYTINEKKAIDIGTGAGFPGVPIKILNNNIDVTLVDSLNKRINFLDEVVNQLKLSNIQTVHSRAEDLAQLKNYREQYDVIFSRAVAPLNILLEYTLPFLKNKGKFICMKGPNITEEIELSKKALKILGGELVNIEEIILPESDIKRNIIVIEKVKNTPKQYPRKAGKPSKEPII